MSRGPDGLWWWECRQCPVDTCTEEREAPECPSCGEMMKQLGRSYSAR